MKGVAVVDTSYLMALLNVSDRFHAKARSEAAVPRDLLIPTEAWTETLGLVLRRDGFASSIRFKEWMDGQVRARLVFSGEREHRLAWRLYLEHAGRLSLTDAVVVAWCRLEGGDLLTFDADQARAASRP